MRADGELVAWAHRTVAHDALLVDIDAVAAARVLDPDRAVVKQQPGVLARHAGVGDDHVARVLTPQQETVLGHLIALALQRAGSGDQERHLVQSEGST